MARKFFVYRLTSPSGRAYVGYTGQVLPERWRQHVNKALRTDAKHPLLAAIRKYGPDSFAVEIVSEHDTSEDALSAERDAVALEAHPYNLAPGGGDEFKVAHQVFREQLADPEWRAAYLERLSAGIKNSPHYRAAVPKIAANLKSWREQNPRQAYKASVRALRVSGNLRRKPAADGRLEPARNGKVRKMLGSKRKSVATKRRWAEADPSEKAAIHQKISNTVKKHHAAKTPEERAAHEAQLAEARKSIDHTVRKARQREALQAYWTPERRAAFGEKMRQQAAEKRAKDADV